jgi:transposase-like protein
LEQYERSQLTVAEFAAQHGLTAQTIHSWRHQQRKAVAAAAVVPVEPKTRFEEVSVAEVLRASGCWAAEVQLADGTFLRWNPQASLVVLQSLLAHLRRPC